MVYAIGIRTTDGGTQSDEEAWHWGINVTIICHDSQESSNGLGFKSDISRKDKANLQRRRDLDFLIAIMGEEDLSKQVAMSGVMMGLAYRFLFPPDDMSLGRTKTWRQMLQEQRFRLEVVVSAKKSSARQVLSRNWDVNTDNKHPNANLLLLAQV